MTKDENPGLWDTSAAGHVDAGEDYLTSAHRELGEELGIKAQLQPLMKIKACPETAMEHVRVYRCETDQKIVCDPGEISEGRYWTVDEIQRGLLDHPERFTSTFRILLAHYPERRESLFEKLEFL